MRPIDRKESLEGKYTFIKHDEISDGRKEYIRLVTEIQKSSCLSSSEAAAAITYSLGLHLSLDDYRGKSVLDAGSGLGKFKDALKVLGVEAGVLNFDDRETFENGNVDVVGKIENLPFVDCSFDISVARYVFPLIINAQVDPEFMGNQITELVRVTKEGGVVRYRPLRMYDPRIVGEHGQGNMDRITERALETIGAMYEQNPNLQINIVKAAQDNGISYDEILEIQK